jgi:hypothetical protein
MPLRWGSLQVALEIRNALDHDNECCSKYDVITMPDGSSALEEQRRSWVGVVPLLSVRWRN